MSKETYVENLLKSNYELKLLEILRNEFFDVVDSLRFKEIVSELEMLIKIRVLTDIVNFQSGQIKEINDK